RALQHRWSDCLEVVQRTSQGKTTGARVREEVQTSTLVDMWRPICKAYAGRTAEARKDLNDLIAARSQRYVDAVDIALGYVALGDRDTAFAWLDTAFAEHSDNIAWLLWRRVFDPIRTDPRFKALEQR